VLYVATQNGLHVLNGQTLQSTAFVETSPARDVVVAAGHAYLATEVGLQVVSLGCG
jgi:hypothetical protein